ncbi:MAG: hypothetical protein L0154_16920 [Chloroflexi bacterium]|nr:hypothetical protein [Chloroflexota bacterium]
MQHFEYDYKLNGWRDGMRQYDNGSLTYDTTYQYDAAGRLEHEIRRNGSGNPLRQADYVYDDVGNRLSMSVSVLGAAPQTTTYGYSNDGLNQLQTVTAGGVTTSYTYDARGDVKEINAGGTITNFTFDARNKVQSVSGGGVNVTYDYDADGNRIRETNSGVTTTYVWDPLTAYGDVIYETQGTVSTERHYTRANGLLLAQQTGTTNIRYLTHDAQGTIRGMLSATGASLLESYDYNAFGDFYEPGTRTTKFAYTGQQYDDATGLYFLRARYYDPAIGRFLSQDPYPVNTGNPMELNRYVYTANNPVNFSDPSGLQMGGYAVRLATLPVAILALGVLGVALAASLQPLIAALVTRTITDTQTGTTSTDTGSSDDEDTKEFNPDDIYQEPVGGSGGSSGDGNDSGDDPGQRPISFAEIVLRIAGGIALTSPYWGSIAAGSGSETGRRAETRTGKRVDTDVDTSDLKLHQYLYRGDSRPPEDIRREGGFFPAVKGATGAPGEIVGHVGGRHVAGGIYAHHYGKYVSTTPDLQIARENSKGKEFDHIVGHVYKIKNPCLTMQPCGAYSAYWAFVQLGLDPTAELDDTNEIVFMGITSNYIESYCVTLPGSDDCGPWIPF